MVTSQIGVPEQQISTNLYSGSNNNNQFGINYPLGGSQIGGAQLINSQISGGIQSSNIRQ